MSVHSLKNHNTFQLSHSTKNLINIWSVGDIQHLVPFEDTPLIIGGGSNILLTRDFPGMTLINNIRGIEIVKVHSKKVLVKVGAGENWDSFVHWALENNLGGIENLISIPGKCGAAPIQNIGAYGVELKDVFYKLEAIKIKTGKVFSLNLEECQFGYRDSIFKNELKNEAIITHVYMYLTLPSFHKLNVSYIKNQLNENDSLTIHQIANLISEIRSKKLPDPKLIPNCGSFFKNPIVPVQEFNKLERRFSQIPRYIVNDAQVKIPAAWLIESCGWKGKKIGSVGIYDKHALIVCNYGAESGQDILRLMTAIQKDVQSKFGILLEPEINIY